MLTSISPLGERARGNRWPVTVAWLTAGATAGGAALGGALGAAGTVVPGAATDGWRLGALAAAAAGAAFWDLAKWDFPVRRQVNEDWISAYRSWVYGLGFGLQLGAGFATVVNTALVPVFMLGAALVGSLEGGLVIGAAFGAVRGLSVTINRQVSTADDLRILHRRLDGLSDRARRLGAGASALIGAAALVSMVA